MTAAIIPIDREDGAPSVRQMDSESLGIFVRDIVIRVAQKLVELKPYIEELWRRIDRGETILGCSSKKEFCHQVLHRTPRAVRYMLEGGNHNRGETVSPSKRHQVTDAEFADYGPATVELFQELWRRAVKENGKSRRAAPQGQLFK